MKKHRGLASNLKKTDIELDMNKVNEKAELIMQ